MTNIPVVSVIVPIYNAEKFLKDCLDSLVNQSIGGYEVICLDNCSTDSSRDILAEYTATYPFMRAIYNESNIGAGENRNKGVGLARGDYIMIVDADDYVAEDYIETFLREMEEKPADIILSAYYEVFETKGGKKRIRRFPDTIWGLLSCGVPWSRIFRKSLFTETRRFANKEVQEDTYFTLCAFFEGASFRVIDYAGYFGRIHPSSTTKNSNYRDQVERKLIGMLDDFLITHPYEAMTQDQKWIFQYLFISYLIALLSSSRGCGLHAMNEKRTLVYTAFETRFPDYRLNPYIGFRRPQGQRAHIRLATGFAVFLRRIRLDGVAWGLYSLL